MTTTATTQYPEFGTPIRIDAWLSRRLSMYTVVALNWYTMFDLFAQDFSQSDLGYVRPSPFRVGAHLKLGPVSVDAQALTDGLSGHAISYVGEVALGF